MNYERDIVLPFINKTLPKEQWTHMAHLYTGLWHILSYGLTDALCLMRARIIEYNNSKGGQNTATDGYHETITVFYLKQLETFLNEYNYQSFAEYCKALENSPMAQTNYPFNFYAKEKLMSTAYRALYIAP
jgi:hypothetical protein